MSSVIKVENISKQYRLGNVGLGTIGADLNRWYQTTLRGREDPYLKIGEENDRSTKGISEYVWALRDINFEVKQGEVLGIIGRNGAGKSTLLKILSRTTTPTTGQIKIKGRVASLLEVGTGFHPELTGRENIFLNGAILGMTKKEIKSKLDEIVDFAGVERYIDTPVKRYSSGMYVRLAFGVAAHLEPEILIVDEVLAVGDAEFQKKAIGKMKDVSQGEGRTVLFVSHNMEAILRLCENAILLKNGNIEVFDQTESVLRHYLEEEIESTSRKIYDGSELAPGNNTVKLISSIVLDQQAENKYNYYTWEKVGIQIKFEVLKDTDDLKIGFNLYNHRDIHILSSHQQNGPKLYREGIYETTVWLPKNFLAEGLHYCGVAAMSYRGNFKVHFHDVKKFSFNLIDGNHTQTARGEYTGEFPGVIRPILDWSCTTKIS